MAGQGRVGENRGRPLVGAVCWLRLPYVTALLALCQGAYSSRTHLEKRLLENLQENTDFPRVEEVRLASGNSTAGRVEVRFGAVWGTVCDDGWDDADARVVCRTLGLQGGIALLKGAYGPGIGHIFMDDVYCTGLEGHFSTCSFVTGSQVNCDHVEDAAVVCLPASAQNRLTCSNIEALACRVVMVPNEGSRNLIHQESTKINITCDVFITSVQPQQVRWRWEWQKDVSDQPSQSWTQITSDISYGPVVGIPACTAIASNSTLNRTLTLSDDQIRIRCSYQHPAKADYSIDQAKVYSVGRVQRISVTIESIRLSDGNATSGRVEVQIDGAWGNVCDNDWDNREAAVVCRSLQLTGGQAISNPKYSTSNVPLLLTNMTCQGLEDSLSLCGLLCRTDACKSGCRKTYVAVVCSMPVDPSKLCPAEEMEGNVTVTPASDREADREQSQRVSIKCTAILAGVMTIPSKISWQWEWRGLDTVKVKSGAPPETAQEEDQLMTAWAPVNRTDGMTIITSQVAAQITQPCSRLAVSSTLTRTLTLQDHRRQYRCQYQHPTNVDYSLRTAGVFCVGNVHPGTNTAATAGMLTTAEVLRISAAAVLGLALLVCITLLILQGRRKEVIVINAPSAMPRGSIRYPMSPRVSIQNPKSPRVSIQNPKPSNSVSKSSNFSTSYNEPTSSAGQTSYDSELYSEV